MPPKGRPFDELEELATSFVLDDLFLLLERVPEPADDFFGAGAEILFTAFAVGTVLHCHSPSLLTQA